MDALETYRATVERVLTDYAHFLTTDAEIVCETVFDRVNDHYFMVEVGWEDGYRIYGPLLHIDIIGGKLWIQQDGTEDGVAGELVAASVPKDRIVLGFRALPARAVGVRRRLRRPAPTCRLDKPRRPAGLVTVPMC